ncbi:hypothetical protein DU490_06085 [Halomonas sp. DQ26W]|uniref:hypothetical protein n=1 Tax=Halomonas sp. DQ26W TaxID=2282311 RepID=UPI000DF7F5A0|nr:hypothetical protein [Halomonas sp. DQ26W]RDB43738.1 hypothetical protein DU490_06085 [Halomonas sp. DQ26W]
MAVLVEATAVILRAEAVEERITGGWDALRTCLPETGVCSDDELVSISLVDPAAVRSLVERLVELGLHFDWEGNVEDIGFADQKRGLITPCDWLTFETVNIGIGGTPPSVAICRLAGSQSHELRLPEGWRYQGSLSEAFGSEGSGPAP